jgi:hypothetical protein
VTEWPESFPPACPPEDAVPAEGDFYRLVDTSQPTDGDFMSGLELQASGQRNKNRKWPDLCEAAALSLFGDLDETRYVRESTGPMRSMKIARGNVSCSGVMKATPHPPRNRSHHSWWRPVGDEAWKTFEVMA